MKTTEKMMTKIEMLNPEIKGSDKFNMKIELPLPKLEGTALKIEVNVESEETSSIAAQEKLNEMAKENVKTIVDGLGMAFDMLMQKFQMAYELKEQIDAKEKAKEENEIPFQWEMDLEKFVANLKHVRATEESIKAAREEYKDDYEKRRACDWALSQINKMYLGGLNEAQKKELSKYIEF